MEINFESCINQILASKLESLVLEAKNFDTLNFLLNPLHHLAHKNLAIMGMPTNCNF